MEKTNWFSSPKLSPVEAVFAPESSRVRSFNSKSTKLQGLLLLTRLLMMQKLLDLTKTKMLLFYVLMHQMRSWDPYLLLSLQTCLLARKSMLVGHSDSYTREQAPFLPAAFPPRSTSAWPCMATLQYNSTRPCVILLIHLLILKNSSFKFLIF